MMILGERSHPLSAMTRRVGFLGLVAILLAALIAGCSGGGGGNTPISAPTPASTSAITGTVVKDNLDTTSSTTALSGIVVTFIPSGGGTSVAATTAADGTFTLNVPSNTGGTFVMTFTGYYNTINYTANGTASTGSASGITIPAEPQGTTYTLGTIHLTSTDGPPPPPSNF